MYCADSADTEIDLKVKVRLVDFQKFQVLSKDDPDIEKIDEDNLNGVKNVIKLLS